MNKFNYESIFYKITRRLRRFQKYSYTQKKEEDSLLFIILGNMNLRLNTIFFLIKNSMLDGVFPLQRTVFEMNIAFKVYIDSNNKEEFFKTYKNKKGFENSIKLSRFFKKNESKIINDEEDKTLRAFKKEFTDELKAISNENIYKTWYEFASKKSLLNLSVEYENIFSYFYSYDLMSNWVHPQSMDENLDINFQNYSSYHNQRILCINLLLSLKYLEDNLLLLCNYIGLKESNAMNEIGEEISRLKKEINDYFILIEKE